MAFLRHLPTSKYWIAQFAWKHPSGKWKTISRSTKIPIEPPPGSTQTARELRQDAQKIADSYEQTANGKLKDIHIRRVISEMAGLTGKLIRLPSVREWMDERLAIMIRNKKENTYRNYSDAAKLFYEWLGEKKENPLDTITPLMMDDFQNWLNSRYAPTTRKKHFRAIKHIFDIAKSLNILTTNPCDAVAHITALSHSVTTSIPRRPFSLPELQLILDNSTKEWRSMILTSLYTGGQRLGDIACLKWDAVDFEKGMLHIRTQKRGKSLVIPLWNRLRALLEERFPQRVNEYVHPSAAQKYLHAGKASPLSAEFGKILYTCGLVERDPTLAGKRYKKQYGTSQDKTRHKNPLSFHSLRYTATTLLHEAGVPPILVQKIVGHDSAKIHEGYAAFSLRESENAFNRLPQL